MKAAGFVFFWLNALAHSLSSLAQLLVSFAHFSIRKFVDVKLIRRNIMEDIHICIIVWRRRRWRCCSSLHPIASKMFVNYIFSVQNTTQHNTSLVLFSSGCLFKRNSPIRKIDDVATAPKPAKASNKKKEK